MVPEIPAWFLKLTASPTRRLTHQTGPLNALLACLDFTKLLTQGAFNLEFGLQQIDKVLKQRTEGTRVITSGTGTRKLLSRQRHQRHSSPHTALSALICLNLPQLVLSRSANVREEDPTYRNCCNSLRKKTRQYTTDERLKSFQV